MAEVFQTHHTNCKIIISPEYKQIRMNPADVEQLKNIFGSEHVYDFSGINQYTNDIRRVLRRSTLPPLPWTSTTGQHLCHARTN